MLREREKERERKEWSETRRSRARKISLSSKNLLFSSPKLQVPPSKGKRKKKRRDSK